MPFKYTLLLHLCLSRLFYSRVVFFHDPINAINAGGCLIVFSGVILYKASSICTNNEAYSPIHQQNENESSNDEGLEAAADPVNRHSRPRLERTPSAESGNRGISKDFSLQDPTDADDFVVEGIQDKMLKLKL